MSAIEQASMAHRPQTELQIKKSFIQSFAETGSTDAAAAEQAGSSAYGQVRASHDTDSDFFGAEPESGSSARH